ncbi:hypothetical protein DVH24_018747, partial [Malus domestica]
ETVVWEFWIQIVVLPFLISKHHCCRKEESLINQKNHERMELDIKMSLEVSYISKTPGSLNTFGIIRKLDFSQLQIKASNKFFLQINLCEQSSASVIMMLRPMVSSYQFTFNSQVICNQIFFFNL